MADQSVKLGEILLRKKWINKAALQAALEKQKTERGFLGSILLADKKINEEQLAMALSEQSGIPFLKIKNFYVDWKLVMKFSASLLLDRHCFPLKKDGQMITFAITNALDERALELIEEESKRFEIKRVLVTYSDMRELLDRYREYVSIQTKRLLDK